MSVKIWEGERALAKDNHFLSKLSIFDVPPKPKGEVSIDVEFEIDANGILKVKVTEALTKQTVNATINTSSLNNEEV